MSTNASIRSGLRRGKKTPRAVPPPKEREEAMDTDGQASQEQDTAAEPPAYGSIDGAAILEDLRAWFARHIVVVGQTDLRLLALWVVHTFLSHPISATAVTTAATRLRMLIRCCSACRCASGRSALWLTARTRRRDTRRVHGDHRMR